MALTDTKCRQSKPMGKVYRLADEKGLYLEVHPRGSKYWRHKYRFQGKERRMAYGVYPEVSLKDARNKRDATRKLLDDDIDPAANKKSVKAAQGVAYGNNFEAIAREWYAKQLPTWAPTTAKKKLALLENDLFPWLGARPVTEIKAFDLLQVLQRIESRGALETAHHARQTAGQIFRYARITQRCEHDPATDLRGALTPRATIHRPAITDPAKLGKLLVSIDEYKGTHIVRSLMALCPILFQRPGEMIAMEWVEVDFEKAEWNIPAGKMKMGLAHVVPLSVQAVHILKDLKPLTGRFKYVFPNQSQRRNAHASNGTINKALQNMGVDTKVEHCAHGFRATARTMLDEQLGIRVEWIEHQLAHKVRDALGRAYNRTKHLPQRREMMQQWSDHLDVLRAQASNSNVITGSFNVNG